jgi:P4 family phage/plasmid primase-like protien
MIQILKLRSYLDPRTNKHHTTTQKAGEHWEFETHQAMLSSLDAYLAAMPEEERYNLYFTALHCKPNVRPRTWHHQKHVPFDIDNIFDEKFIPDVSRIVHSVLGTDKAKTLEIWSGNGMQFLIEIEDAFFDINTFNIYREHYRDLITKINKQLKKENIPGEADPTGWGAAKLLRLPKTENRKPIKGIKQAFIVQENLEPQNFRFEALSQAKLGEPEKDYVSKDFFKSSWLADNKAIMAGCDFLKFCNDSPEKVQEPEWYSMLSITSRMQNGKELSHNLSKNHPNYSPQETDEKIEQALEASGPRTCKNINFTWGKCKACKNYNLIKSPILIKSPEHIATEFTGFHSVNPQGRPIPQYRDLMKYLNRSTPHKSVSDNGQVFLFNGTHYEIFLKNSIYAYAEEHFSPSPMQMTRKEFESCLLANNQVDRKFFNENTNGFINCKNGVVNLKTKELLPHSPEYGFRYCLPYAFDSLATAPRFEKFLQEVTRNDDSLKKVLEEFGGYAISGDEYWHQKTMLLVGSGANGKSTYLDILKMISGPDNYSAVSLQDLKSENNRQLLEGKLFNVAPEISRHALKESEKFKYLSDGSEITVKVMWSQPYRIKNRAKMIFACNDMPESGDTSHGFLRRFAIVNFGQTFTEKMQDKFILNKLKLELSGILNVFLAGYDRLLEQRAFTASESMQQQQEIYAVENNPIRMFLDMTDEVKVYPLNGRCNFAPTIELKKKFDAWCVDVGQERVYQSLTIEGFSRMFAGSVPEGKNRKGKKQEQGERHWGYFDVEILHDA